MNHVEGTQDQEYQDRRVGFWVLIDMDRADPSVGNTGASSVPTVNNVSRRHSKSPSRKWAKTPQKILQENNVTRDVTPFYRSPIQLNPQNLEINTGDGVNNLRYRYPGIITRNTKEGLFLDFFPDYE